jgi:hypothetical protein
MVVVLATVLCGGMAAGQQDGPAPNSGDGIPDGSGWDETHWPEQGKGPAPNSGNGIPDGPGW